jgi:high-affinity nickel permease
MVPKIITHGLIFGLGFDTASEVALLAMSAGVAAQGLSWLSGLSLPLVSRRISRDCNVAVRGSGTQ